MKTSKPFSTISYNTPDFLRVKLDELIRQRKIEFWCYFHHYKEEDELKDHKHLYIVPNGQLQTDQVGDYLLEVDPTNPKPLSCIRFKSSNFTTWFLYSSHDQRYLASIGQSRKYHYTKEDCVCSDLDYLNEEIHLIDYSKLNRFYDLKNAVENGETFVSLMNSGQVPIQQISAFQKAYDLLVQEKLERNGRKTHTPIEEEDM